MTVPTQVIVNPNITIDCLLEDRNGNEMGVLVATAKIAGWWKNKVLYPGAMEVIVLPAGSYVQGLLLSPGAMIVDSNFAFSVHFLYFKKNWMQWSRIGSLDFTVWKDNEAGGRPMEWPGWVYKSMKIQDRVVVYGENGVSNMLPSGVHWGLQTVYKIGLKGKNAAAGNEKIHYFIDNLGQLFSVSEGKTKMEYGGLSKLGYEEYLSSLNSNVVLTYDELNDILYICDGTQGFVYRTGSLGNGPANITGLGYKDGTLYVAAPEAITTQVPFICTDINDMGTRRSKDITGLEIGADLTETLQVAINYRYDKSDKFFQTPWCDVDRAGRAHIECSGVEFQFKVQSKKYEWFKLDYINVFGVANAF